MNTLRPYQQDVAMAINDSAYNGKGLTFSVEIARQGGKNELSAHVETWCPWGDSNARPTA